MHVSIIFFLAEHGVVERVPQQDYVHLLRRQLAMTKFAGQQVRVADWYVRLLSEPSALIENETYSIVCFDGDGWIEWPGTDAPPCDNKKSDKATTGQVWAPTAEERGKMLAMIHNDIDDIKTA